MPGVRLGPDDYRTMPWANGRGSTLEYVAETRDGALCWRVSKATVAENGPFSPLPGIDRTIMLVSGPGFRLDFENEASRDVRQRFHPVPFSGDWQTSASGVVAPCEDLNVMTRRGMAEASVGIHRGPAETAAGDRSFFLCFEGVWTVKSGTGEYRLADQRSCLLREDAGIPVELQGSGILVEISINLLS